MLKTIPQTLQSKQHYRSSDTALAYKPVLKELDHLDCVLYRISSVTYHKDTDAPQMQALENVLSSLRIPGVNIIYLMLGDKNGVEFYYGIARDYMSDRELKLSIKDIAREILAPSIRGNFRGSKLEMLDRSQKEQLLERVQSSSLSSVIEGVPGVIEEEGFQGADRLADTMINIDSVQDSSFGFMVVASCVNYKEVDSIKMQIYEAYQAIACLAKESVQTASNTSQSTSRGTSDSHTQGTSHTTSTNESHTKGTNEGKSTTTGTSTNESQSHSTSTSSNKSTSHSTSQNTSTSESHTKGTSTNTSQSSSKSTSHSQSQGRNEGSSTTTGSSDSTASGKNSSHTTGKSGDSKSTSHNAGESITTTSGTSTSRSESSGRSENITKGSSESESRSNSSGENESESSSRSESKGTSESQSTGTSESESSSTSEGKGTSESQSTNTGKSSSHSSGTSESKGTSESHTKGTNESSSTQEGSSQASTREIVNKYFTHWQEFIDEILIPRLDYASGKGLFASGIFCFANSQVVLHKLQNTIISLFSGQKGNKIPLRAFLLESTSATRKAYTNLQLPHLHDPEPNALAPLNSQSSDKLANWLSTKELSLIAGLPQKDIIGLELREEVEFGLNVPAFSERITLGHLTQSGNATSKQVGIDRNALDRHIFITGVTGSGKTTTTQTLLLESALPFLVIEPAKTEYRILQRDFGGELLVFTLGKDDALAFRLNPFEFFPHESITSRIDMIRASIEAAFDMEAAIPQLIEQAIYKSYEDKGWNIASNENDLIENPWVDGVYAFPTLSDVLANIESVVEAQGFGDEAGRLKGEYIGSIKARLGSLVIGSKGFMLDTKRSIDFIELLSKKVVLEMEEIRNGAEKSLVMGLVLGHLLEAIKARFKHSPSEQAQHIIVIEEAHRLLSKFQPGDNPSKKQAVESFADMLAEVRKYGECLIIADQIPNKLTPEVLKNTNTKIVHKLFAQDDKQAIANTIALEKEQMEFLSRLDKGVAVVFSSDFHKAVAVQITPRSNTSQAIVDESELEPSVYGLYAASYQRGIVLGSQFLSNPSWQDIKQLLRLHRKLIYTLGAWCKNKNRPPYSPKLQAHLQEFRQYFDDECIARVLLLANGFAKDESELEAKLDKARKLLQGYGIGEITEAWDLALALR